MQSLILATSLVMSTPVTIDGINNNAKLDALVDNQIQHVTELVLTETRNTTLDNYLVQAKLAIQVSKEYVSLLPSTSIEGAE